MYNFKSVLFSLVFSGMFISSVVFADDGIVAADDSVKESKVWLDVGVKGAVGGDYLSKPDVPDYMAGFVVPFDDGAGGIGGGGGIFADLRILKQHLGLEVGLLFDANKLWCNITQNGLVKVNYAFKENNLRIPVLLKGNIVNGITRIGLGIGPEFIIGTGASTDVTIEEGAEYVTAAQLQDFNDMFSASKRNDVALAWEFSMAFMVKKVAITLDLRFSYNLTLPKGYLERVEFDNSYSSADIQAGHTVDGRILLGAAYMFDF
ncbi:MAG: outer membrane beta-barrel protein [Deltaproteobacteria bacterium]|nr:outer membrane beta-barrel protein [Deltaproteobacteria bacterium]